MDEEYFDEILCPTIDDNSKKCGNCLKHLEKFCSKCGCKVDRSWFVKPTVGNQQVCTGTDEDGNACGQPLDLSKMFCSNCGTKSELNVFGLLTLTFF